MAGQFITSVNTAITAVTATGYITVANSNLFYLNAIATISKAGVTSQLVKIVEILPATNQLGLRYHPAAGATNNGLSDVSAFNAGLIDMPAQFIEVSDGAVSSTATGWTSNGVTTTTSQNISATTGTSAFGSISATFGGFNAGGGTAVSIAVGDYIQWGGSGVGFFSDAISLVITGNAAIRCGTDEQINVGSSTVRFSNGYFGQLNVKAGAHATSMGIVPSVLNINTSSVASATAGPNDLITYSLPAAALNVNGKGVRITAWGTTTNNANAKTVTLRFGATAIITTALTTNQAGVWRITADVIRTGAATQISSAQLIQGGTTTLLDCETGAPAETLSGAVTIKCTGTNEITQLGLIVEEYN